MCVLVAKAHAQSAGNTEYRFSIISLSQRHMHVCGKKPEYLRKATQTQGEAAHRKALGWI